MLTSKYQVHQILRIEITMCANLKERAPLGCQTCIFSYISVCVFQAHLTQTAAVLCSRAARRRRWLWGTVKRGCTRDLSPCPALNSGMKQLSTPPQVRRASLLQHSCLCCLHHLGFPHSSFAV